MRRGLRARIHEFDNSADAAPEILMENPNTTEGADQQESPRIEPWFKVMLCAFVPMGGAFVLPPAAVIPMFVVTGIVLFTGLVMLIRHERKNG